MMKTLDEVKTLNRVTATLSDRIAWKRAKLDLGLIPARVIRDMHDEQTAMSDALKLLGTYDEATIEKHMTRARAKLTTSTRTEAVAAAQVGE